MTTFNRLPLKSQLKVAAKVKNYPDLKQNVDMLTKVDPILSLYKNGSVRFLGNNKELFEQI